MWMKRNFPKAPFERYADDGVIHCQTKEEALWIKEKLTRRFEECKLELHPVKTRIVYWKDIDRTKDEELTEFDFLGYTFKAVYIKCKDGKIRNNFIASVSKASSKNFREKIRAMCKYKNFRGRRRRAEKWLCVVRKREPKLFAHWSILYSYC